jgi:hypothetical protein
VVEHTLIGGSRVVQSFGIQPKDISWRGRFFASNVQLRVQQLRLYAVSGQAINLIWKGQEAYSVIIKDFTPEFKANYAEYSITLAVVNDLNGTLYYPAPVSIDQQVAALQQTSNALVAAMAADNNAATQAIQAAQANINGKITAASPLSKNLAQLGPAIQTALQGGIAAVSSYRSSLAQGNGILPTAIQLGGVYQAISKNIAVGSSTQTLQMQGGNLFQVAAQYYGDVTQAFTLTRVAGLQTPFLPSGLFNLIPLPPLSKN